MGTSVFIAQIFGLFYLVAGVGIMVNRKGFKQVIEDFCKNTALLFYGGMLSLAVGIVIVLKHNVWVNNWTVIITVIGWIALIKGIWIVVFPNSMHKFMQIYKENERLLTFQAAGALILGAVLTYFGFFAG